MLTVGVFASTILISYLIGAIPFGYLIAWSRGVNIFQHGSANIGATNVGRVLGPRFGVEAFVLDFLKGAVPTIVSSRIGDVLTDAPANALAVAAGLAAFLGHLFPIYLRFRGGKGVATGAGVVAVLLPVPALIALLAWVGVLLATRYVSSSSVVAVLALCAAHLSLTPAPFAADNLWLTVFSLLAAMLVVVRHRGNLTRLWHGTENQIKERPAMLLLGKIVHVLALALWFGTVIFFSFFVALSIFHTTEDLAAQPPAERPAWLSDSFNKDAGSQLAGIIVGPIFPTYFVLQGVCGFLALMTALGWSRRTPSRRVDRIRFLVLLLAVLGVLAGWPVAQKVSELRTGRYSNDPAVAADARTAFGAWHGYSLAVNMATAGLVTIAMTFAARLPNDEPVV